MSAFSIYHLDVRILEDGSVLDCRNHHISLPSDLQAEYLGEPGGAFFHIDVLDAIDGHIGSTATALVYQDSGRIGIATNSDAEWGDFSGDDMVAAISDYFNDAEAWAARN